MRIEDDKTVLRRTDDHNMPVTSYPPLPEPGGDTVTLLEASDILNVAPYYCRTLIEKGTLAADEKENIQSGDLMRYKQWRDAKREEALREITRIAEESGNYD
jgi:hypothetical protein